MSNPSPPTPDRPGSDRGGHAVRLQQLQPRASPDEALAFFDSLPPVTIHQMLGAWRGAGLPSGHPLDGLLERFGWYGKRFDGADAVHPLVMGKPGALFSLTPSVVPLGWVRRNAPLLERGPVAAFAARSCAYFGRAVPRRA